MNPNLLCPDEYLDLNDTIGTFDYEIYDNPLYQKDAIGSFSEYIINHHENECLHILDELLSSRQVPVGKVSKVVPKPEQIQLDCGHIEKIYFCETSKGHLQVTESHVQADVILKVKVALYGNGRKAVLTQMYRMTTVVGFINGSMQFAPTNHISIYMPRILKNPLSEYLVPILSKNSLDDYATDILELYYPEALNCPGRVSGLDLAKRLGLNIECHSLSDNQSILGQLFFEPGTTAEVEVPANTIVVDKEACKKNNNKSVNLVILHECVHYILHRYFFLAQHLYNNDVRYLCSFGNHSGSASYSGSAGYSGHDCYNHTQPYFGSDSPLYWVEYQADQIAYRLQLPAASVKQKVKELSNTADASDASDSAEKHEWVVKETAVAYGVSKSAAKYRLASLGYKDIDGVNNYVDGTYIPAYSYAKGALKKNQTFTVDFKQLLQLYWADANFRNTYCNGTYAFVEGHMCRNDKKYITSDGTALTPYARSHMDECCLIFTKEYGEVAYSYQEGSLHKEGKKSGFYIVCADQDAGEQNAKAEDMFAALDRVQHMIDEMPRIFSGTLKYHMDRLGWTHETLAENCKISDRTVTRLLAEPYPNAKLGTVILLCLGMKLDPMISRDLIDKSCARMPPTKEFNVYHFLIDNMYLAGIDACNQALIRHGFKPLPVKEDAA